MRCTKPGKSFLPGGYPIATPCGKCVQCASHKNWVWTRRTNLELFRNQRLGGRTWFTTLTLRFADGDGSDYGDIQRFLKRLRKQVNAASLRYVVVKEHGTKKGRLHWHALLIGDESLKYRTIRKAWKGGFAHTKLIKDKKAGAQKAAYCAKYIHKEGGARTVRASNGFGTFSQGQEWANNSLLQSIQAAFPGARLIDVKPPDGRAIPNAVKKKILADANAPHLRECREREALEAQYKLERQVRDGTRTNAASRN